MDNGFTKAVFGIFAVVGWLILMGLHVAWHYTFGWIFKTLADLIDIGIPTGIFGTKHPFAAPADWLRSLDRNVDGALVASANDLEHSIVWLFSRLEHLVGRIGKKFVSLALALEHAVIKLVKVTIPKLVRKFAGAIWRELRSVGQFARKMIHKLNKALFALERLLKRALKYELDQIFKFARRFLHGFRDVYRTIKGFLKRLLRLERWLLGKKFNALVAAAMHKLGIAFLFTYNWKWAGSWFTKFSTADVVEFTKDAITVAGSLDICKVAQFNYDLAVRVIEPPLRDLIGLSDFFCRSESLHLASGMQAKPGYIGSYEPSATSPVPSQFDEARLAPGIPLPKGVIEA